MRLVQVYLLATCGMLLCLKAMVVDKFELAFAGTLMVFLAAMILSEDG